MIFEIISFSCKKTKNSSTETLALIQHKWILISHNGEALRYVGTPDDYYNFSASNYLYMYVNKTYDTLAYILLSDNKTLSLYPIVNGVRTNLAKDYNITVLDNNHFVIGTNFNTVINVLDSLKR